MAAAGLGDLASLSDELLLHLLGQVEAAQLACLSCVSKALYCFAQHEELWRMLVLEVGRALCEATCLQRKLAEDHAANVQQAAEDQ